MSDTPSEFFHCRARFITAIQWRRSKIQRPVVGLEDSPLKGIDPKARSLTNVNPITAAYSIVTVRTIGDKTWIAARGGNATPRPGTSRHDRKRKCVGVSGLSVRETLITGG
jgi:hypothetical protein